MSRFSSMLTLLGILLFPLTQTNSQWVQQTLPTSGDIWGLVSRDSIVMAGTEIGFQGPGYVFRSTDFGVSWSTLSGLPYAGGWSFVFSDSFLIAGSFGWGLFLSSDLGNTWSVPDSGISPTVNVHSLLKHGNYLFAATGGSGNGIFRSSDNGFHWIAVDTGLTTLSFLSLASNGQDLYAGSAFTGEVFHSSNDGMNWFSASTGLPANSYVATLAANGPNVYAGLGSGQGVYYSSDNGTNWFNISPPAFSSQVWTLVLADTNLFVGSIGSGIFLTKSNGLSWITVNEGLANLDIRSLMVTSDDYLFAGTTNGLVCYRPISEMTTGIREITNSPSDYRLSQCYPNPFNSSTNIVFYLPVASDVTLQIFNELGQEVSTLVSEYIQAGQYEIEFNANQLSSGVYYYRIITKDFIQIKKAVLLK